MDISAVALAGMQHAENRLDTAARRLSAAPAAADTVDLSAEMIEILRARNEFAAGVKVAQTADEMQKATLNILA